MSNFHLQEIQSLQNSLREREEYVTELENRLRALWDKYDGDRKHYMDRIKRLEEAGIVAIYEAVHGREDDALEIWHKAMEGKENHNQQNQEELKERIKRLEDRIHRASVAFFRDGSDGYVASQILQILEEDRGKP